jgi:hypothetical protein
MRTSPACGVMNDSGRLPPCGVAGRRHLLLRDAVRHPGSDPPKKVYAHKTFNDVSDAVSFVLNQRSMKDLFFAIHTLKEHQVWDPNKVNLKTGEVGSNTVRTQSNAKEARCFFFDLDVGPEAKKYQSQAEAAAALRKFCETTGLPKPLITSSGGGLHVYWIIVDPLESNEWRNHAMKLKQLAWHHGLKVDDSRTTDTASVLRVAGTFNLKDRSNPREVKTLWPLEGAAETGTGLFIAMLDKAMIEAGVEAKVDPSVRRPRSDGGLGTNTVREYDGRAGQPQGAAKELRPDGAAGADGAGQAADQRA